MEAYLKGFYGGLKWYEGGRNWMKLSGSDGKPGTLGLAKGRALGRGCIDVPVETSEKIREFLEAWGVEYSVMKALVA